MAKIHGVVTGQVISRDDPDQQGRIQVSLPFLGGENSSYWAPVATMMAGNKAGSWFMPEIGDEVLIAFLQDDLDRLLRHRETQRFGERSLERLRFVCRFPFSVDRGEPPRVHDAV